ncbi:MAG: DUF4136 domain-containing protein, partial [Anaerolineae bacterium]
GIRQVESDGDLIVHVHARLRVERQIEVWNTSGWGYRGAMPGPTHIDVRDVPMGTVVVDLVDRAEGVLAWRGVAEGIVNPKAKPEEAETRVNGAMAELFKGFPPGR